MGRTEQLRKQLELEKEKTMKIEEQLEHLPPIKTNRVQAHPGYAYPIRIEAIPNVETPITARYHVHALAFNQYYQSYKDRQLWQGYCRTYEQDMQAQFMIALTKGPKLYFPKFSGDDPVGWLRQLQRSTRFPWLNYMLQMKQMYG